MPADLDVQITRNLFVKISLVILLVAYCCEVPKKLQVEEGISKALNIANRGPVPLFGVGRWGMRPGAAAMGIRARQRARGRVRGGSTKWPNFIDFKLQVSNQLLMYIFIYKSHSAFSHSV